MRYVFPLLLLMLFLAMTSVPDLMASVSFENTAGFKKITLGGDAKVRMESRENDDFNDRADDEDTFFLTRIRVFADVEVNDLFRAYVRLRDAELFEADIPHGNAAYEDSLDLYEGFLEIRKPMDLPLKVQVGRMEFNYGEQRLIGGFDWSNVGRQFDAVRLIATPGNFEVHAFAANRVIIDDHNFNRSDPHGDPDDFYGIYTLYRGFPERELEGYILLRENREVKASSEDGSLGDLDEYTAGIRTVGKYLTDFDYGTELAYQFGNGYGDRIKAYAVHFRIGYTFADLAWRPRVGVEYNLGSGDKDPTDGRNQSFYNLFPTNHPHYGYIDAVSWRNARNYALSFKAYPMKDLMLKMDLWNFRLKEARDALYSAGGKVTRRDATGNSGKDAGQEIDLLVQYKLDQHWSFLGGYSYFIAGDFIEDAPPQKTGDNADFSYVQVMYTF